MSDDLTPDLPEGPLTDEIEDPSTELSSEGEETSSEESSEPADPYADFGGRDTVEKAYQVHQALQTEDGVWNLFFQAGRSLGLGVREIEALFQQAGGEPEPEGPADDEVMTFGQFKSLMDETVVRPQQVRDQQMAEAMANQSINSTVAALGITDPDIREAVLQLGDKYLGDDISPAAVKAAVEKGHAAYLKLVQAERKQYTQEKRDQGVGVPKAPAGGTTSATTDFGAEPKDAKEAIRRARLRMKSMQG
jgi:hypothetical protein